MNNAVLGHFERVSLLAHSAISHHMRAPFERLSVCFMGSSYN